MPASTGLKSYSKYIDLCGSVFWCVARLVAPGRESTRNQQQWDATRRSSGWHDRIWIDAFTQCHFPFMATAGAVLKVVMRLESAAIHISYAAQWGALG